MTFKLDFDWDALKAKANKVKHGVSFERAVTIFTDANLLSIPDIKHSETEERWITIGIDSLGVLLVLVHTFADESPDRARIRIISARKATRSEIIDYEEGI